MSAAVLTTALTSLPQAVEPAGLLAEGPRSQPVTDWGARIGWVVGLLLLIALVYWLMRQGWKWRGLLQSDLPPLPVAPAEPGRPLLRMAGRYHGSTSAGQWLDRIVVHGLGTRSRAELLLTEDGLTVTRPGAQDFFVPTGALRGARLDKGIAGKVLTEGGLLVVVWAHGDRLLDSGFRSDHPHEHTAWVTALGELAPRSHSEPSDPAPPAPPAADQPAADSPPTSRAADPTTSEKGTK